MIDSYIILNRKTNFIIKTFIFNILIIGLFVIWGINTFYYHFEDGKIIITGIKKNSILLKHYLDFLLLNLYHVLFRHI